MFTLLDTDFYTDTDTDRILWYCYVKNSVQSTDTDACTDCDADGYCTQFGTNIRTNKVEFISFSLLLYNAVTIGSNTSVAFLPSIIGICIGTGIGLVQCKRLGE